MRPAYPALSIAARAVLDGVIQLTPWQWLAAAIDTAALPPVAAVRDTTQDRLRLLMELVSQRLHIPPETLQNEQGRNGRRCKAVHATGRKIICHIGREHLNASLAELGRLLHCHHTTALLLSRQGKDLVGSRTYTDVKAELHLRLSVSPR